MANAWGKAFEDFSRYLRGAGGLSLENRSIAAHFRTRGFAGLGVGGFPLGDAGNARPTGGRMNKPSGE